MIRTLYINAIWYIIVIWYFSMSWICQLIVVGYRITYASSAYHH